MQRVTFLLLVGVIATSVALAQTQNSGTSGDTSTQVPSQTYPNPDGTVTTPSAGPGPTTPIITLGTTSPSPAGATNATPGNQAGATNSTLQPTVTGGIAAQTVYTTPVLTNAPNPALASASGSNPPAGRDLAIGAADSAWAISANTMGVAEAARLARAARAAHKPRVFTNADIARLRGNGPVSVVGNTAPPVTNEQTMPASDVQEPEQNGATTPATPAPNTQAPPANQNPSAPKSPFRPKPSPNQPK